LRRGAAEGIDPPQRTNNSEAGADEADRQALDALPPAERAELFAAARSQHPLLRAVKAEDSNSLVIAAAVDLYRARRRASA
jgi:hypothetical protein